MSRSLSNSVILSKGEESRCVTYKLSHRDSAEVTLALSRRDPSASARDDILNPPERPVRTEFRDFPGGFLADVNGDADDKGKGPDKSARHQPGGNVTDVQSVIKRSAACDRFGRVQKNFRHPRHHDENENENVIPFQPASDGFEFRNLEGRQNEIFTDQFFPFALEHLALLHHEGHQKLGFQDAHALAVCFVKEVTLCLDPEHYPND